LAKEPFNLKEITRSYINKQNKFNFRNFSNIIKLHSEDIFDLFASKTILEEIRNRYNIFQSHKIKI